MIRAFVLTAIGLLAADASAGRKPRRQEPTPEPVVVEATRTPPVALFDAALPISLGPVPVGLANASAQGCAACHWESHASWSGSAHATGWRDPAWVEAIERVGAPACQACHLPLIEQRPQLVADDTHVGDPVFSPNPAFDATLRLEGVTCAACHVRGGTIIGPRPPEEVGPAPHPLAWSESLRNGEACGACHQLTWPGADAPIYDTWGEWSRSAYAAAGVGCVDCHGRGDRFDHGAPRGTSRALSILIDLPTLELPRGDEKTPLSVTLQNTGAGHAFPTGSPFVGAALVAWLDGPPDRKGAPTRIDVLEGRLERRLDEAPPWRTVEDTRLPAGGTRTFEASIAVPTDAPTGDWNLRVEIVEIVGGKLGERVLLTRSVPVRVP